MGQFLASYMGVAISSIVISLLNNKVQDTVGKVEAGPGPIQWSFKYFVASANAAVTFYCTCFGDALWKGSPAWVGFLSWFVSGQHSFSATKSFHMAL